MNTAAQPNQLADSRSRLIVRNANLMDVKAIAMLTHRVYSGTDMRGYSESEIIGQINNFPQGQFAVTVDEKIVGYCATFRIAGRVGLKPHSWIEITGNGYGSKHDAHGDWLYDMEVCVDPGYQGYRIGQRLYTERKALCKSLRLKGIVFVGRLPSLAKKPAKI